MIFYFLFFDKSKIKKMICPIKTQLSCRLICEFYKSFYFTQKFKRSKVIAKKARRIYMCVRVCVTKIRKQTLRAADPQWSSTSLLRKWKKKIQNSQNSWPNSSESKSNSNMYTDVYVPSFSHDRKWTSAWVCLILVRCNGGKLNC